MPSKFDLSPMDYCHLQWGPVLDHLKQSNEDTLKVALQSYPGPFEGYKVREFPVTDFELMTDNGDLWLTRDFEPLRPSCLIIGTVQQPDGDYHFTTRYCRCPDGTVLYFD
ncbi:hypothetical protein [Pseudomonas sp. TH10]|uniref:hypothetical protein n=1 Tax=Pseudomonas sp. TH10 TaxID=2796376 RepID=UPI0019135FF9|nr:hypothetical protein [Pseudomonas sp. TH10]MBK5519759.1 hypothetical protein [Pseudomonas sp. TH10]